jgi:hypothetical protein
MAVAPKTKVFSQLIILLVLSTCLQNVLFFPYFENKIQITEIIFPFVLLFFPTSYFTQVSFSKSEKIFLIFLFSYLALNILSSFISSSNASMLESFGRVYLGFLFLLLILYFSNMQPSVISKTVPRIFFSLGWVLSVLSLSGYILLLFNIENRFVYSFSEYPYLGTIYRLNGPTFTPSMLITILSICLIFSINSFSVLPYKKLLRIILLLLIILATLLTFSKTLLLVFWGVFIIFYSRHFILSTKVLIVTLLPILAFLFFATHFILAKPNTEQYDNYLKTNFISSNVAFKIGETEALETCYFLNKRLALDLVSIYPLLGIGAGNFNEEVEKRKSENRYPPNFLTYDPHSTYFGALAETGILGFSALILLFGYFLVSYANIQRIRSDSFFQSIFILLVIFFSEAISTDIMNFRHFWVLLAIAFSYKYQLTS